MDRAVAVVSAFGRGFTLSCVVGLAFRLAAMVAVGPRRMAMALVYCCRAYVLQNSDMVPFGFNSATFVEYHISLCKGSIMETELDVYFTSN